MYHFINKNHDSAIVLTHMGLGDNLTSNPFIRYLRTIYDKVYTSCFKKNYANLVSFYNDDPNIILLDVNNDQDISPMYNFEAFIKYSNQKDVYLMGYHKPNCNQMINLPFNFYDDVNCPYEIFWNYFKIDTAKHSKLLDFLRTKYNHKYIFVHNTYSGGQVFDYNLIKNKFNLIKNEILFINPCVNMYDKTDNFYQLAEQFVNKPLSDYVDIIINANYVMLSDSSFFCLSIHLPIKTNNCYVVNGDGKYDYLYSNKYKYSENSGKKRFISIDNKIKSNRIHFITFGGGGPNFHDAVKRLTEQARAFNIFDKIYGFTDLDLKSDPKIWNTHSKFILANPRFYGYAIWKSYLIRKVMDEIDDGDLLLYLDCGCELNIHGKNRFMEYIEMVKQNDSLATQLVSFPEKHWTKTDFFNFMETPLKDRESGQIQSGFIFLKKNSVNINLLDEWFNLQTVNNYHYVDDTPSLEPNNPSFVENRHDQSCFSLLMKKYNRFVIPDETYFYPDWTNGIKYPIWTIRNKTGRSVFISNNI